MSASTLPAAPIGEPVLRVKDLRTEFALRAGVVKAVDGVSFEVGRGRILGLSVNPARGKASPGIRSWG